MLTQRQSVLPFVVVGVVCSLVLAFWAHQSASVTLTETESTTPLFTVALQPMFFEADNFNRAIASAESITPQTDIYASIVPQHLLASSLIAQQLRRAGGRVIDTVVIIGPNHFNIGPERVASAQASWQTPLGLVEADSSLTNAFITDFGLQNEPSVFANEHAVGAVTPFVKYYFPKAKILPIVFSSYASGEDARRVATWLADNLPSTSLVVYSIDFSHYLVREAADVKDRETRELIESGDVDRIMKLGNDHLDSPASLSTALLYAGQKNLRLDILTIKNSDDFSAERTAETTSYIIATFSK